MPHADPHTIPLASAGIRVSSRVAKVLTVVLLVGPAESALAWGPLGHRVAAKVAEARLTPAARQAIRELLEPGESLADASTWADDHRDAIRGSAGWHFVNVPIREDRYNARFCKESGCVVSKITQYRRILVDPRSNRAEKREALRILVHLIQDVHQPLHVGENHDRGGNDLQVQFFRRPRTLHQVWDSAILQHHIGDETAWVREVNALATPEAARAWAKGSVVDWANESLAAAKTAYIDPTTQSQMRSGARLGPEYQDVALPIARRRLAQAGTRLASVLNGAFP